MFLSTKYVDDSESTNKFRYILSVVFTCSLCIYDTHIILFETNEFELWNMQYRRSNLQKLWRLHKEYLLFGYDNVDYGLIN